MKRTLMAFLLLTATAMWSCKDDDENIVNDGLMELAGLTQKLDGGATGRGWHIDGTTNFGTHFRLSGPSGSEYDVNLFVPKPEEQVAGSYTYSNTHTGETFGGYVRGNVIDQLFWIGSGTLKVSVKDEIYSVEFSCMCENGASLTGYYKGTMDLLMGEPPVTPDGAE